MTANSSGVPAAAHASHPGRSPRARSARVNDGYDPSYPRSLTSSNSAVAQRCGSSPNRIRQYDSNGANRSGPAGFRRPGSLSPFRYARIVLRSLSRCRAIADTDHPLRRSACASTDSPCVSIDDELPLSYRTVTPGSIRGSRPAPKNHGGVSPKLGKFSEQVWGISGERQQDSDPGPGSRLRGEVLCPPQLELHGGVPGFDDRIVER